MTESLERYIREVPDFPKPGILFRDITPALLDPAAFRSICDALHDHVRGRRIDKIAAVESRGFIFGSVLAYRLGVGFVPMRKSGKLPWRTVAEAYALEYGEAAIEMPVDAVERGERILILDDLLATGGTAAAAVRLVEGQGAVVEELAFVIELGELGGRDKLPGRLVWSLMRF
jgi:adenine phosphoribosyltransferase